MVSLEFCLQLNWLSVDFNNWKDWEDDSEEDLTNYDRFSDVSTFSLKNNYNSPSLQCCLLFWLFCEELVINVLY